jgi:hypothetical protein
VANDPVSVALTLLSTIGSPLLIGSFELVVAPSARRLFMGKTKPSSAVATAIAAASADLEDAGGVYTAGESTILEVAGTLTPPVAPSARRFFAVNTKASRTVATAIAASSALTDAGTGTVVGLELW